jgi:hypothetical protein
MASILPKDLKILWGKAAGRCSICRKKLVHEASDEVPSKNILLGENCHIVAEKSDGPRGDSILSLDDRNRYPNLILLCRNDHTIIDQDDKSWPIEKLHQIKADHEIWVETQLTEVEEDYALELYSELINMITEQLMLTKWDYINDHAVRLLLYDEFVEGIDNIWFRIQKTIWPGKFPELEKAIKNLSDRSSEYVKHFLSNSILRDSGFHTENKSWTQGWNPNYDEYSERAKQWQKKSTNLLFNLTIALNEYAESVRKYLKINYLIFEGKFLIIDSFGVISGGEPAIYEPKKYIK